MRHVFPRRDPVPYAISMPATLSATQLSSIFTIDAQHATPVFHQLHDRVVAALAAGTLAAGQQLPTVRALAQALELAPNTVAKAYKTLETAGIVEGKGRAGTFIRLETDPLTAAAQQISLNAATAFIRLGVTPENAAAHLTRAFAAVQQS